MEGIESISLGILFYGFFSIVHKPKGFQEWETKEQGEKSRDNKNEPVGRESGNGKMKAKARILIVDDDKQIPTILSDLVKKEGLEADVAYDGGKALKAVHSGAPDLMLVDIMLPDINGLEVLRQVREFDPELPVVFITGHADARGAV